MAFLTSVGSKNIDPSKAPMGERILSTNPVLEAFGNAKTARNDNSSRFGKYVKLYFDQNDGKVLGAEIKNYLLEKSRVVGATSVERNYHIFFFMLRGISDQMAQRLGLAYPNGKKKNYKDFKFLAECTDKNPDSDIEEYKFLMEAFHKLGFTEEEIDAVHRMTAASVHVGQLQLDTSTFDDGKNARPVSIKNPEQAKLIAGLLGINNVDDLITELVHKGAMDGVKGRTPEKPSNVVNSVDSMAKAIFDNLFNWLVAKMNIEILPDEKKSGDAGIEAQFAQTTKTVGLLDIFGFENFELNQFEQLCINFVNEKLHNLYISSVFGAEKKEMEREGLQVDLVLPELKVLDVLRLLDNSQTKVAPLGVFNIIADRSQGTLGNDDMNKRVKDMYNNIVKNHEPNAKVFKKKKNTIKFTICHSAKDVVYDSKNFIERNADMMSPSLNKLLLEGTDSLIGKIYSMKTGFEVEEEEAEDPRDRRRRTVAPKTIWGKFSLQIQELMNELAEPLIPKDFTNELSAQAKEVKKVTEPLCEKCDLHFIRCIKPCEKKKDTPIVFVHAMTLQQITYMGVLESIKVKQENFPYRKKHEEFYRLYELLSPAYSEGRYDLLTETQKASKQWDVLCNDILERVFAPLQKAEYERYFAAGKTKILMMGECRAVLEQSRMRASRKYDKMSRMLKRSYKLQEAN